ncbi:MAG: phosphoribosylamine--glycine ligase PurD [Cyanobacteria bacterium RYN_339]|nr:phosphoribosylamine--glycine ligase PurD [Cyanobacteria bacterium RYN_339]
MPECSIPTHGLKILVVGQGGREHAIVRALARSPRVARIHCAPGNAGTAAEALNVPIGVMEFEALAAYAIRERIDLAVVGPADPVAGGLVDHLRAAGVAVFGPTREQAVLEGSKVFSKAFMRRHGIPTARCESFSDADAAFAYLDEAWRPEGIVIKVDGLADVQSTLVTSDRDEARAEIARALVERRYGEAGDRVLIEERLIGPEVSLLAFVDGRSWKLLPPARDHKQLLEGGFGPNTEGMGAFCPAPGATPEVLAVLDASLRGMRAEGLGYPGVLFVGVLLTAAGPRVLEYNCRFGDPETQVTLNGLQTDLVDVIQACLEGRLADIELAHDGRHHVCVVAADPDYPGEVSPGKAVTGLDDVAGATLLHAQTRETPAGPVAAGGRVLNVVASGENLEAARAAAYAALGSLRIGGEPPRFRRDVGQANAWDARILTADVDQPAAGLGAGQT